MNEGRHLCTREDLIKIIKDTGQSIIDNAESILGDERYFIDVDISININRNIDSQPDINIHRRFIPEKQIEDEETYNELKNKE